MLNGEPTVELDYSRMHVSLIYGLSKEQPPKDPYTVPLIDEKDSSDQQRKWIKSLVLQSLNAKSKALGGFTIDVTQDVIGIEQYNSFKAQEANNTYLHHQLSRSLPRTIQSDEYKNRYEAFCEWRKEY